MFLNPQKVVENNIQIFPGMKIADFGAGRGDFSLALSPLAGNMGKIYAIDIKPGSLEAIKNKIKTHNFNNIHTIQADLEHPFSTTLKNESVHSIILSNALFQINRKENLAREAHRILYPNGKLFLIEWLKRNPSQIGLVNYSKIGPKNDARIDKSEIKNIFEIRGFNFEREFPAGDHHLGLVFKKI